MRVRAKHNINLNGAYYRGGDVFEISTTDAQLLNSMIEIMETPVRYEPEEPVKEAQKPRGRRKKTEE